VKQIGLLNQILVSLGGEPQQWLINSPLNTFLLIVVMIWIQAGFAMTVLSAAIKAIPEDVIEAARLDGVTAFGMFRFVTLPSIRPAVVVVLTTISIATLKVFDIVQTMTGGRFDTSVVANEFYSQSFRSDNQGLGAALAVLLFLMVVPIVVYNIRQLRASEGR
jgi:alpha-glucoside transport system permease protein